MKNISRIKLWEQEMIDGRKKKYSECKPEDITIEMQGSNNLHEMFRKQHATECL